MNEYRNEALKKLQSEYKSGKYDKYGQVMKREDAYRTLSNYYHHSTYVQSMALREALDRVPAADVRPVVLGHLIGTKEAEDMGDIMKEFTCSVCGCCEWDCTESESFNFCPNCGAKMEG